MGGFQGLLNVIFGSKGLLKTNTSVNSPTKERTDRGGGGAVAAEDAVLHVVARVHQPPDVVLDPAEEAQAYGQWRIIHLIRCFIYGTRFGVSFYLIFWSQRAC